LIYYLRVYDRTTGQLLGRLGDLTTDGVMLISEEPIEIRKTFHLRIDLPEQIEGRREITFEAISRWASKDINPNFHDTGFQFSVISRDDLDAVIELIEELLLPD